EVVEGGPLTDHKGANLPDTPIDLPSLSDKDIEDLRHGASLGVDWVALSFIRSREDLRVARGELRRVGSQARLMAKIELRTAVDRFAEILEEADGIMIARGDLGVEMGPETVPVIQKRIIRSCLDAGKPVVTATQMLESMIRNPTPTRAEASDVANAIFDGTDAVMLSAETATGEHPAEAVRMMDRIIRDVESSPLYHDPVRSRRLGDTFDHAAPNVQDAICLSATRNADVLGAKVIASFTSSGSTAWRVARHRPRAPTVALTPHEHIARQLSIGWGILALLAPDPSSSDHLTEEAIARLRAAGLVQEGDTIVVTAGVPFGRTGTTNMLRVERVPAA
ncbi:MAG: pyruvate kinase, partial [Planctomycetes bacterium]|nr:pyruvate kinase [Planctomycetota bacterium]